MRVLMLTQWFQPEEFFKGLPLAQALRDRGHEIEVLTGFPNYPGGRLYDGYRVRLYQRENMEGIRVNRVPLYPSHDRNGLRRIANYVSFSASASLLGPWLIQKPDVVYVYNLVTLGVAAGLIRFFRGAKIVLDVQDLWPESVISSGMLRIRWLLALLGYWCRLEYSRPDHIIVLSPGCRKHLINRGITPTKIDVVYNWCDETSIVVPAADPATASRLAFSHRFNVVFTGTMGVMQALDVAIAAARKIRYKASDVLFTFVGSGIELPRLKQLAGDLDNVQFLPRMPPGEIGQVLANSDALLVHLKDDPIFQITIPSKIQTYLYAGKPILCGVRGDAANLVSESGAGITFLPGNEDSLIDAILKLRAMPIETRRNMGNAGSLFYRDHLSFKNGVSRIEGICRRVCSA